MSKATDIHASLLEAKHQLAEAPPPHSAEEWRGMHALRRATLLINTAAFGGATVLLIRAIRARGHATSDDFGDTATAAEELAMFDDAIAVAAARVANER